MRLVLGHYFHKIVIRIKNNALNAKNLTKFAIILYFYYFHFSPYDYSP